MSCGVFRRDSKSRNDIAVRPSGRAAFPEGRARRYACPRSAELLPSAATMQIGSNPSIRTNRACWSRPSDTTYVHASRPYLKAAKELSSAFAAASDGGSELMTQHNPAWAPLIYWPNNSQVSSNATSYLLPLIVFFTPALALETRSPYNRIIPRTQGAANGAKALSRKRRRTLCALTASTPVNSR